MKRLARNAIVAGGIVFGAWLATASYASADTYSAKVGADMLNIRAEPAGDATIIGTLGRGDVITVSDESYGWAKVKVGGKTGWVAAHYLVKTGAASAGKGGGQAASAGKEKPPAKSSAQTAANAKLAIVTADKLWLRAGPGTDNEAKKLLTLGTRLTITDSKNGWLYVQTPDGTTGWVSGRYVGDSAFRTPTETAEETKRSGSGLSGKLIVLDPGHGGDDPGVIGTKYETEEKKLNLSTAQYVAEELRRAGAKVVMTRTSDNELPELSERAGESNRLKADAFVSIHYNASPKKVSGTLVYFYSDQKDRALAHSIEESLAKNNVLKSNGIAYGDYHVLRENSRPAVLLELGFLTDARDEATVRTADYQRKAAKAIVAGLANYFSD
jgi:N-acetylmuramoyl-L-alanine amidase